MEVHPPGRGEELNPGAPTEPRQAAIYTTTFGAGGR